MISEYIELVERIRGELSLLAHVVERTVQLLTISEQRLEYKELYTDSLALNLHGFYVGMERVLYSIAKVMDRTTPTGEGWHRALLLQMSVELPGIRQRVLSDATVIALDEYRKFRHVIRNVYSFELEPEPVEMLTRKLPGVFASVSEELEEFASRVEEIASDGGT